LVIMFNKEAQKKENLKQTLLLLYSRFKILAELESSLSYQYEKGIRHLEKLE